MHQQQQHNLRSSLQHVEPLPTSAISSHPPAAFQPFPSLPFSAPHPPSVVVATPTNTATKAPLPSLIMPASRTIPSIFRRRSRPRARPRPRPYAHLNRPSLAFSSACSLPPPAASPVATAAAAPDAPVCAHTGHHPTVRVAPPCLTSGFTVTPAMVTTPPIGCVTPSTTTTTTTTSLAAATATANATGTGGVNNHTTSNGVHASTVGNTLNCTSKPLSSLYMSANNPHACITTTFPISRAMPNNSTTTTTSAPFLIPLSTPSSLYATPAPFTTVASTMPVVAQATTRRSALRTNMKRTAVTTMTASIAGMANTTTATRVAWARRWLSGSSNNNYHHTNHVNRRRVRLRLQSCSMNALTTFLLHHLNKPCLPKNPATLVNMLPIFDLLRGEVARRHASSVTASATSRSGSLHSHHHHRSRCRSSVMQRPLLCHNSADPASNNVRNGRDTPSNERKENTA